MEMCRDCGQAHEDPADCDDSRPRHPNPRCKECGEILGDADRAEVYVDPDHLRRGAGGQHVLVDDIPDEMLGPYLVHAEPCFTGNRAKYGLA